METKYTYKINSAKSKNDDIIKIINMLIQAKDVNYKNVIVATNNSRFEYSNFVELKEAVTDKNQEITEIVFKHNQKYNPDFPLENTTDVQIIPEKDGFSINFIATEETQNLKDFADKIRQCYEQDVVKFTLNHWSGEYFPAEEPFPTWMDDDNLPFVEKDFVLENKLVVTLCLIDMSVNLCITAPKAWVIKNCPAILEPQNKEFIIGQDRKLGFFSLPAYEYLPENIGIHYLEFSREYRNYTEDFYDDEEFNFGFRKRKDHPMCHSAIETK